MLNLKKWLEDLQVFDLDMELMETSFTHSSYRGLGNEVKDYVSLEFLGEAVINIMV